MSDARKKKLNVMKVKILEAERENLKTREKTNDQMVELIVVSSKMNLRKITKEVEHAYKIF